jgi:hypothetical protein
VTRLDFDTAPAVAAWVILVIVATLMLCVLQWLRRGKSARVAMMEGVRFLAVSLAAMTLLQPEIVRETRHAERPQILVLSDRSRSMETRDVRSAEGVQSRTESIAGVAALAKGLEAQGEVRFEDFAAPPADAADAPASGTDLNGALEAALRSHRNLRAVLLVTDGDWNSGMSPVAAATKFRARATPVIALGAGSESALPDLILERTAKPSYGLLGEQISIPFHVRSHLPREVRTTVVLQSNDGPVATREVTIPAGGEVHDAVVWLPGEAGEYTLQLRLPNEPEEAVPGNNQEDFRVAVRSETLRVLVVESVPRWEYRYLRNALVRDPGVEVETLLLHPGMEPGAGRDYIAAFPGKKEELSKFDVIFLGDVGVGERELSSENLAAIRGVVEQQGSGLVLLPGMRGRQLTFAGSELGPLLPVELDPAKPAGHGSLRPSQLVLTEEGKGHLLTMLSSDRATNENLWKSLPGFQWSAAVLRARPGSQVLAVHGSLRSEGGRVPLLATRTAGNGKVLFMGTDAAWRWRRGVEDKYHYRFWCQVVRWMAHQRHLAGGESVRLSFDPENPRVGDRVLLLATVFDASGFPLGSGEVEGRLAAPSGATEHIDFAPVAGGWGVFQGEARLRESGVYKLRVQNRGGPQTLETELFVSREELEKIGQPANFGILRELAAITGGLMTVDAAEAIEAIRVLPEPKPIEERLPLWRQWWWGAAIVVLLVSYWTARKFAGMI